MKRIFVVFLILICNCTAINKANKLYNEGNYSATIAECQKIIANDSLNAEAHFILGKCYHAQGKLKEAVRSLTKAYQILPETNITHKAKSELINTRIQFADILSKQQKFSLALEEYQEVLKLDSMNTNCLLKLGDLYQQKGKLSKALNNYKKILKFDEQNQLARGKIKQINERTALAEKDYQQGKEYFQKYKYNSAIKYLEKALENKPDHKDARYYIALTQGAILYKKGRKSYLWDAIQEFGKAMVTKPESGEPHYYMGLAYEKKDRREFDNAIQEYKLALEKEPKGYFASHCKKKVKELTELKDRLEKFWGK